MILGIADRGFSDARIDDPVAIEQLIDWYFSHGPISFPAQLPVAALKDHLRQSHESRRQLVDCFSARFLSEVRERWGVFCMTPIPNSTLMWSHHAESHRGICLEFDATQLPFAAAIRVEYRSEYPDLVVTDIVRNNPTQILTIKSDDWAYEKEYRLIAFRRAKVPDHPLVLDNGCLRFRPDALRSIVLGCEADVEEIGRVIVEASPDMVIKRAMRSNSKYNLTIETIGRAAELWRK